MVKLWKLKKYLWSYDVLNPLFTILLRLFNWRNAVNYNYVLSFLILDSSLHDELETIRMKILYISPLHQTAPGYGFGNVLSLPVPSYTYSHNGNIQNENSSFQKAYPTHSLPSWSYSFVKFLHRSSPTNRAHHKMWVIVVVIIKMGT